MKIFTIFLAALKYFIFYNLLWCTIFFIPNLAFLLNGNNVFGIFIIELLKMKQHYIIDNIFSFLFFYLYLLMLSALSTITITATKIISKTNLINNLGINVTIHLILNPIIPFIIFYFIGFSHLISGIIGLTLVYTSPIIILLIFFKPDSSNFFRRKIATIRYRKYRYTLIK